MKLNCNQFWLCSLEHPAGAALNRHQTGGYNHGYNKPSGLPHGGKRQQEENVGTPEVISSGLALGAEVRGVALGSGVDAATIGFIKDALHQHSVLVLRNQRLTPPQQIDFCRRFGKLEAHSHPRYLVKGHPELLCISNIIGDDGEPLGLADAGTVWHTDGHFDDTPNLYSMLYALEIPHDAHGQALGDTLFASTAAGWDRLPEALQNKLLPLKAENSLAAINRELHRRNPALQRPPLSAAWANKVVVHPAVRTHPVTGRKAIYVASAASARLLGLPEEESRALIEQLQTLCTEPDQIYRHRWQVGDLLMWDNCTCLHRLSNDFALPQRRLLHRTTLDFAVPF